MSPPDDLYPPVIHGPAWTVLPLVVLAMTALWWLGLWWLTRPRRSSATGRTLRGRALAVRRASAAAAVDDVVRAHAAGRISPREAFQQLSPIVRRFVFDVAGVPAHTMSLTDLEREHPGRLAEVVGLMYPVEFAAVVDGDVGLAGERAREVVLTWIPTRDRVGGGSPR